jgi:TRAP-type C4-dicarboxylate transport system permease small subunit
MGAAVPEPPAHPPLVLQRDRHLKWVAFDPIERVLMLCCGVLLGGFVLTVFLDVVTRTLGHPWLWLQEVTSVQFIYCTFLGAAVAVRRDDHLMLTAITGSMTGRLRLFFETLNRVVILTVALCMIWFGVQNVQLNFASFRMPSLTPLAYWVAAIPLSGVLISLFIVEQLVNGWKNGFETNQARAAALPDRAVAVETT